MFTVNCKRYFFDMNNNLLDYYIIVAERDRADINYFYRGILEFLNRKESVPYEIVQRFLDLLSDLNGFESEKRDNESIEKALIAEERLSGFKGYKFDYTETDGTFMSFKEILRLSIRAYLDKFNEEKIDSKEILIRFFFEVINEYFKPKLVPEMQKELTKYRSAVISAVLTEVCWSKLTTYKQPTPAQLYQAVKYALNKKPL